MRKDDVGEGQVNTRRLHLLMLIPLGWMVFAALLPDFAMRLFGQNIAWLRISASGIGFLLICVFTAYLLGRIRRERKLVLLVMGGTTLLLVSQSYRFLQSLRLLDGFVSRDWNNVLRAFDNLFTGLGLVLIAVAFFLAIIEMMASRQRLMAEHARLTEEVARREQVEKSLRENEAVLHGISASALDGIVLMDNVGSVCYWNPAAERILGYAAGEVMGKSVHETLVPSRMRNHYLEGLRAWRNTGEGPVVGKTTLVRAIRKDGAEIDVEISVSSLHLRGEWHTLGIIRDVTARREAEEEHQLILRTAMDGFWVVDVNGRILDVNEAYCRMIGYSRDELLNMSIADVEAIEMAEDVAAHIQRVQTKGWDRFETRHRRKDGSVIDVEVSTSHLSTSGGRQYCFLRDITEHKRDEQSLQASESKYRDLVQNANTIIARLDAGGTITFFNEFAEQFFGLLEKDLRGQSALGTILPGDRTDGSDLAALLRLGEKHPDHLIESKYEWNLRDGRRVWISWTSTPVYNEQGRIRELLCVGNDVTSRVEAERIIVEQQARMLHASRLSAVGTMASGIAHEINNPLAIISGAAQQLDALAHQELPDTARLEKVSEVVGRNVNRISRIIRALRMLSRDGSQDPYVLTPVQSLVADILELCQARFLAHGIMLEIAGIPNIEIECLPPQISQVLLNLLNNAHDAVETLPEKWIRIGVQDEGDTIALTVTDSGRGLAPETREKAMLPFFTTKEPGKGVGLGLSISAQILEAHHGELIIDANYPNTRFVARLPKHQPIGT
ncbi:MAG TPA: PAS domain S-box protein [Candidatus Hydrogenedentes bacterium]|nr:PAS domain S-box protein [Candidatus Hydrogenedentota bacterium]